MREAPPLRLQGRGHRGWQRAQRIGCAAAALVPLVWLLQWRAGDGVGAPQWILVLGLWATLIGVAVGSRRPAFELQWVAGGWQWRLDPRTPDAPWVEGQPMVRIDAGHWLLLELRPAGPGRRGWLALAESDLPGHWHLLRCALYSPRRMNAPLPTPTAAAVRPSADDR
ncbi:MAG: hypothetical protein L6Q75_14815 [Burkholderiaceae bacterium]|nr:hypothetical protein [Burkholderiaceae bacterium]